MSTTLNNEEFLGQMMNYSRYGALSQIFILDAVYKQATMISALTVEQVEAAMGDLINGKAWHGVATEIAKLFEEQERSQ